MNAVEVLGSYENKRVVSIVKLNVLFHSSMLRFLGLTCVFTVAGTICTEPST